MKLGRHDIDGDLLYTLVQEVVTAVHSERLAEQHRRYADVMFLLEGEETIFVSRSLTNGALPIQDRQIDKDYVLYNEVGHEIPVILKPDMLVVLYPDDLHRPACSKFGGTTIRKIVFKIDMKLLVKWGTDQ